MWLFPLLKKTKRKVYRYQKGDYESMRKDTLKFAKEKYFNGHSDTRSVQESFNLILSFIQDLADKHTPSKTSRSVSSVPWIIPEIRRKIHKKNETHAKAKRTGSAKIRSKFETLKGTATLMISIVYKKELYKLLFLVPVLSKSVEKCGSYGRLTTCKRTVMEAAML